LIANAIITVKPRLDTSCGIAYLLHNLYPLTKSHQATLVVKSDTTAVMG